MNETANRTAGLEPADAGSGADHPVRDRSSPIDLALQALEEAQDAIRYLNRQEAEIARVWISQAQRWLQEVGAPGQG